MDGCQDVLRKEKGAPREGFKITGPGDRRTGGEGTPVSMKDWKDSTTCQVTSLRTLFRSWAYGQWSGKTAPGEKELKGEETLGVSRPEYGPRKEGALATLYRTIGGVLYPKKGRSAGESYSEQGRVNDGEYSFDA